MSKYFMHRQLLFSSVVPFNHELHQLILYSIDSCHRAWWHSCIKYNLYYYRRYQWLLNRHPIWYSNAYTIHITYTSLMEIYATDIFYQVRLTFQPNECVRSTWFCNRFFDLKNEHEINWFYLFWLSMQFYIERTHSLDSIDNAHLFP